MGFFAHHMLREKKYLQTYDLEISMAAIRALPGVHGYIRRLSVHLLFLRRCRRGGQMSRNASGTLFGLPSPAGSGSLDCCVTAELSRSDSVGRRYRRKPAAVGAVNSLSCLAQPVAPD